MEKGCVYPIRIKRKICYLVPSEDKIYFNKEEIKSPNNNLKFKHILKPKFNRLILVTTGRCNFDCVYCYSSQFKKKFKDLEFDRVKHLIRYLTKNYWNNIRNVEIIFTGGGEPTLNWSLIKGVVEYASKIKDFNFSFNISSTNGYLSDEKIRFIIHNKINLKISFDGTKELQNRNRKLKNNNLSFDKIKKVLKTLDTLDYEYRLHCVITENSLYKLEEIISYVYGHFKPQLLSFGLEKKSKPNNDIVIKFVKEFIKAKKFAEAKGIKITAPDFGVGYPLIIRCAGEMTLLPNGDLSLCHWAYDFSGKNKIFYLGHVSKNGKIRFLTENITKFRRLGKKLINKKCETCIARFYCGGGCPNQRFDKSMTEERCKATVLMLKNRIKESISEVI